MRTYENARKVDPNNNCGDQADCKANREECTCHQEIDSHKDEELFSYCDGNLLPKKLYFSIFPDVSVDSWLKVSKELIITKDANSNRFISKIALENKSSHCISYNVVCSQKDVFHIYPRQGILSSKEHKELNVMSVHSEEIMDFGAVSQPFFEVAATPIYFNGQTNNLNKLKLLWKEFGSDAFPYDAAEIHVIRHLIPIDDSYLDSYNICERALLGNYVARKEGQSCWTRGTGLKSVDFSKELSPNATDHQVLRVIKDLVFTVGCLNTEVKSVVFMHRMCLLSVLMFAGALFLGHFFPLHPFDFGSNGFPLQDWLNEQTPSAPKGWWQWLTSFF